VTVKFVKATADFSNAEKPLEPEFQSESRNERGRQARLRPVALAIDGNADTAWGIDAGPAAQSAAQGCLHS
jgi:hypothetical protein